MFEITGKGDLVPGDPFILTGLPGSPIDDPRDSQQSIAFQNNSTAYALSQRSPLEMPGAIEAEQVSYPDADPVSCPTNLPRSISWARDARNT